MLPAQSTRAGIPNATAGDCLAALVDIMLRTNESGARLLDRGVGKPERAVGSIAAGRTDRPPERPCAITPLLARPLARAARRGNDPVSTGITRSCLVDRFRG
jgi:hypothetical protein